MCPAGLCTANIQGQYETEPNNTPVTANPVVPGKLCATITPSGDKDWFAITLPAGVKLTAAVAPGAGGVCGPTGTVDPEVEIAIPTMLLAFNDDINPTNWCSSANTPTSAPGTYFVRVAASQVKASSSVFTYCLTLTVSP